MKAQEVLVVRNGELQKNIELLVGKRFKKRGMSWSREEASKLLKLRIERQDPHGWQGWWQSLPWRACRNAYQAGVGGQGRVA